MTVNNNLQDFLTSFFRLFNAYINNYEVVDNKVLGTISWVDDEEEDEPQNFSWSIEFEDFDLLPLRDLCTFLLKENLLRGDKIIVTEKELKNKLVQLNWQEEKTAELINNLCSIEMKMLDDGEETDSFYIHF